MKTLPIALPLMLMANVSWSAFLSIEPMPTVDMPGFTTYTFSIETQPGEILRGVDATVRGPLNQVNPLSTTTIFNDSNGFFSFVGADVSQDSQFLFTSSEVLFIGAEESDTLLKAAISNLASLGLPNRAPFVQIVTDMPDCIDYEFAFDLGGNEPVVFQGGSLFLTPDECVPEPTAALLATLMLVMYSAQRRPIQ